MTSRDNHTSYHRRTAYGILLGTVFFATGCQQATSAMNLENLDSNADSTTAETTQATSHATTSAQESSSTDESDPTTASTSASTSSEIDKSHNGDNSASDESTHSQQSTGDASNDSADSSDTSDTTNDETRCVADPFEQIDASRIFADIKYLASAELEGRLPGTKGDELAQAFAVAAFQSAALEPAGDAGSYLQRFSANAPTQSQLATASIDGQELIDGADFQVYLHGRGGFVSGELIDVGYGLHIQSYDPKVFPDCPFPASGYDDFEELRAHPGSIALLTAQLPTSTYLAASTDWAAKCPRTLLIEPAQRAQLASQNHAAMVVMLRETLHDDDEACHHAPLQAEQLDFPLIIARRESVSAAVAGHEALQAIDSGRWREPAGRLGLRFDFDGEVGARQVPTANILGIIRGTDPEVGDEVIVVGGHIDHLGKKGSDIYYGADDNASGAAIVMELARQFRLCGIEPKRTILFAEFNAEEMGLLGSNYYVEHPALPLEDTIAMYNFDMVGAGDSSGVLVFGGDDPTNKSITALLRSSATQDGLDYVIEVVPQKLATDHAAFVRAGIPATFNFARPDPHPGYHTPDDDIDNIKIDTLEMVSRLYWSSLRRLAMAQE